MNQQRIIWAAVPAGGDPGGYEVDVCPLIRLSSDVEKPTLSLFPDFLNWPSRIRAAGTQFVVEFEGGPAVSAQIIDALDSITWPKVFLPETPVQSFMPDRWDRKKVITNAASCLELGLRAIYRIGTLSQAQEFFDFSGVSGSQMFPEWPFAISAAEQERCAAVRKERESRANRRQVAERNFLNALGEGRCVTIPAGALAMALASFVAFHQKVESAALPSTDLDFHQLLSGTSFFQDCRAYFAFVYRKRVSVTGYGRALMARSSKARLGSGLAWCGGYRRWHFSLSAVVTWIRHFVARSASRLRKLWTGRPSSVRPVAFRLAAAERSALATMLVRIAAAAS